VAIFGGDMSTEPTWWGNLDPTDDAWHPASSGTFAEWWYFDARFDPAPAGYALSVAWQVQGVAPRPPEPSLRATLFMPDAAPRHLAFTGDPADFAAAQDACDVRLGPSWLRGAPPRYEMHVAVEDVTADLTLTSLTPAWKHWDWHIVSDRGGKSFFAWTVAVPMGRVAGTLRLGNRELPVTGRGYRDKCWMGGPIFAHFDRWYAGRLHSTCPAPGRGDDVAIVYYVIPSRRFGVRGDFLNACAVFVGGRLAYEVRPETAGLGQFAMIPDQEARDPVTGRVYPLRQTLELPEAEHPVIGPITVETEQLAARRVLPPADMGWLRRQIARRMIRRATIKYLGTWTAELPGSKRPRRVTGEAFGEIVYLR